MSNVTADWFVAADAIGGDGSRERPFHDPWLALRHAGPGDVIHIAAGTYYGRYDRSSWMVDSPQVTIRGGYSRDFSKRNPWQTPAVFAAWSGYESTRENNMVSGRGDHSGLILDGLFFDASGRNTYGEPPIEETASYPAMDGPIASFNSEKVTIRNCVFANSTAGAVELSGDESRFENNFVVNIIGTGMLNLRSSGSSEGKPVVVANNAFCFIHDVGPPCGTGTDSSIGVRISRPALIQNNIFVSCGNAAISLYKDLDRVAIERNLFFLTPRDIVNSRAQGNSGEITESNIDELEDLGFKAASNNTVSDPGMLGFRSEWLDAYSRHLLANYVKPPREQANAMRAAGGLPPLNSADLANEKDKGAFAPRLRPADVLGLHFGAKQGFHAIDLPVEPLGSQVTPPPQYRSMEWGAIDNPDSSLNGTRVELRVGLGFEQNTTLLPDADPSTHMSVRVYRPRSDDGSIYVLMRRFTLPTRQFEEAIKYTNGREAECFYRIRGIYRTDLVSNSRQKATIVVEEIVPSPQLVPAAATRPNGRDWFIRAGASSGDGSREKPFRDPFQALEKAEGGDTLHVTTGEYFGKLKSGKWKILVRNLSILGGYNADFTERDPWQNPTRFALTTEERAKGTPEGTVLESEENSDGLVLDGFIFDGATYNNYLPTGSLDVKTSPRSPLLSLRGGTAPITVRNCLFVNASGAGVNISCPYGVFENNVIVNTSGWAMTVRADGPGPWQIRNNTILFAADATTRAGTGKSSSDGTLLHLTGRATATIEGNIFAFADNFGLRMTIPQQNISVKGNRLAAILYCYLTDAQYLWANPANWERRLVADSSIASANDNSLELPRVPVDPGFGDAALTRLFNIPSGISAEQWKSFACQIGASAKPASPAETTTPVPEVTKPEPARDTSVAGILASLSSMKEEIKKIETPKPTAVSEPLYCPVFDWKNALALAQPTPLAEPGAHRVPLKVQFGEAKVRPDLQYAATNSVEIEADHAALEGKLIELQGTEVRSSSANRGVFPTGITDNEYEGFYIVPLGDPIRTRVAALVRLDTAASKVLRRAVPTDKLRVRGTARVPSDPSELSIVVDNAEFIEN